MQKFQTWIKERDFDDQKVAELIGVSRVQVSRIRRGQSKASAKTAGRLEALTGIPAIEFLMSETPASEGAACVT